MNQFNNISNGPHNDKAYSDSLAYLKELSAVRFRAAIYELLTVFEEVALDFDEFLDLVSHDWWIVRMRMSDWSWCMLFESMEFIVKLSTTCLRSESHGDDC